MRGLEGYQAIMREVMHRERMKELMEERFWLRYCQQLEKERSWWNVWKYVRLVWFWYRERKLSELIGNHRREIINNKKQIYNNG